MSGGSWVATEIAGVSEDEAEHSQEDVEASHRYPPPSDRLERQLARRSSFPTFRAPPGSPVPLSPGLQYNSVSTSLKRRRSSKAVMHEPPRSKRESKGRKLVLEGDGPLSMDQGYLVSLARRTRGAKALNFEISRFQVMEALNEFAVTMEYCVHALRNESEVEKGKVEVRRLT
ncbi:hypothetical protein DY000_02052658 [Brassica cretica]|uniref:Histone H2A/H2B/H3 domain-containing protein n=1 Tax=Brassica cretica TaxID=69181 RepID=A0ABQ7AIA1_BRACR|nr:hypothetical protein DY000_02052658 [Brassica cretica]